MRGWLRLAVWMAGTELALGACGGGGESGGCITSRDCAAGEQCVLGACEPGTPGPPDGEVRDGPPLPDGSMDAPTDAPPPDAFDAALDRDVRGRDAATDAEMLPDGAIGDWIEFGPGQYEVAEPDCEAVVIQLWGGGGGGGGDGRESLATAGDPGGTTRLEGGLIAGGGEGGAHGQPVSSYAGGAGGEAAGGTTNLPGGPGGEGTGDSEATAESGAGGDAAFGGSGGAGVGPISVGAPGDPPGGGGSGAQGAHSPAAGGGAGGFVEVRVDSVQGWAEPVDLEVGAGGAGGRGGLTGGAGADGLARYVCVRRGS